MVASLGSGFFFLLQDQGDKTKHRLFHSLAVRLGIALTLAGLLVYGIATGQLGSRTPWDAGPAPAAETDP